MGAQEQAFRTYYASMTEAKLLETAAHRTSFIGIAQQLLDEELARRNLSLPPQPVEPAHSPGGLTALVRKLRHPRAR